MLSYYDILGVDPTADVDAIRRAWRVKVRLLHPDKHLGASDDVLAEAARETLRVNRAWETLGDPIQRRRYDLSITRRHDTNARSRPAGRPPGAGEDVDLVPVVCPVCNTTQRVGRTDGRFVCTNCKMPWAFAKCEGCNGILQVAEHRRTWRCERCGRHQISSWAGGDRSIFCVRCHSPNAVAAGPNRFRCARCGLDHVRCGGCGEYSQLGLVPRWRWRCVNCRRNLRRSSDRSLDRAQQFSFLFSAACFVGLGLVLMARML
ncbi:MAG TPA: DnaJ domain-containing protein [Acidimicrobiia bacterium]|nr:DnaJ domain-containing protein [Acidimicrobiia bacterium]